MRFLQKAKKLYELVRSKKMKNARWLTSFDPEVDAPCKVEGNYGSSSANTIVAPEAAPAVDIGS
jgi:hypothetical protein